MNDPAPGIGSRLSKQWLLILAALAAYLAGFLIFYPDGLVVADEGSYIAQAEAFAGGHVDVSVPSALSGGETSVRPSTYPIGTSLLQSVFVWAGGWRAARFASLISLIATVLLLGKWLEYAGRPVWFAMLVLLYPPTLVLGRIGMSDLPSAALVLLGVWLFWTGAGRPAVWFAAGAVAGSTLVFRESNVLVFVPLFGFAIARRERGWPALLAGSIIGAGLRLLASYLVFGDPLFHHAVGYGFSLRAIPNNAGIYMFALLVMVPGGLLLALMYRGERRWPVLGACVLFVVFYLSYNYNASESGRLKQLILAPRFFIPLLPVMVFAMAESATRLWRPVNERGDPAGPKLQRAAGALLAVTAVAAGFAVHPAMAKFSRAQSSMARAIYAVTPDRSALVTNRLETWKFINPVYGSRALIDYDDASAELLDKLQRPAFIVLLERTDSDFYREAHESDRRFLERTRHDCKLAIVHDQWHDSANRLLIWRVSGCSSATGREVR